MNEQLIKTELKNAADTLAKQCQKIRISVPITHKYNPLIYARNGHNAYIDTYAGAADVIFLGMNPGPFGMAQTGVPFGEIAAIKEWLKLSFEVNKPKKEHPKRLISGLSCPRNEISGQRFWGLMQKKFNTPKKFFKKHYVANYCPLVFMEESGKNRTPDKLPAEERNKLYKLCDQHLQKIVETIQPKWVIGIGKFAEKRATSALCDYSIKIGTILHPSPASPLANRGWDKAAEQQLKELGIWS